MNDKELDKTIVDYENIYKLPTTDVIKYGADKIVKCLVEKFDLKYNI
jgi:hypothetical protein